MTTKENIYNNLGQINISDVGKIDDLYFKPDEKDKIIIDLSRENAQLKDCVIELTKKLYCKENKKMSKGLSDAKTVRFILKRDYQLDFDEQFDSIEKELQKPQQLYDLIKQKCANAQWDRNMQSPSDPDVDPYDLIALEGQIAAYNDVLSLIESMFEVKDVKEV